MAAKLLLPPGMVPAVVVLLPGHAACWLRRMYPKQHLLAGAVQLLDLVVGVRRMLSAADLAFVLAAAAGFAQLFSP